jgi:hypothetical protein
MGGDGCTVAFCFGGGACVQVKQMERVGKTGEL